LKRADVSAWLMNVTDQQGVTVMVLPFTAAVQIVDQVYLAARESGAFVGVSKPHRRPVTSWPVKMVRPIR
jgi:hypothetical protein